MNYPDNESKILLSDQKINLILNRFAHQLHENHLNFDDTAIIGLQPRGVELSRRIYKIITQISGNPQILYGELDTTFYRDDFRRNEEPLKPNSNKIDFIIEKRKVVLIDDVLYTGRSVRAALDALTAYGRPASVELLCLIDRRYSRELPIEADYVGVEVDTRANHKVKVMWDSEDKNNKVLLTHI